MRETQKMDVRMSQAAQDASDVHSKGQYLLKYHGCSCGLNPLKGTKRIQVASCRR